MSALPRPLALPEEVARHVCTGAELARRMNGSLGSPGSLGDPAASLLPTGVAPLDRLLGGGLPRGGMVELSAFRSSGRHSIGLSALAALTSTGEPAALVDLGGHLDPRGAAEEGVDLRLLLWIRPRRLREALSAAEIAAATGLPLVVLDLGLTLPRGGPFREEAPWLRLARTAQTHESALLVLSPFRLGVSASTAVVTASFARPAWVGTRPGEVPLLAGLSSTLTLEKRRGTRPGERAIVRRLTSEFAPNGHVLGEPASVRVTGEPAPGFPEPLRGPGADREITARRAVESLPALRRALA